MNHTASYRVNAELIRRLRLKRGWTQNEFAKRSGYSERLIRNAELGGPIRASTLVDLAKCLSCEMEEITFQQLTCEPISVAKKWTSSFDTLGVKMLDEFRSHLAADLVFVCAGNKDVFPFHGVFYGIEGHQKWLDAFFGVFVRVNGVDATYASSENYSSARWFETVVFQGVKCPPLRVNMHFHFRDGLVYRIEDDYDTAAGAHLRERILDGDRDFSHFDSTHFPERNKPE